MKSEDAEALIAILLCYDCDPPDIDWSGKRDRICSILERALSG
jgi:hypothetical protein